MVTNLLFGSAMPNEGQTDNGATTETQGGQEVSTTTETEGAGEPSTTTDTRPPDPNRPITKAPDPGSGEDREQK